MRILGSESEGVTGRWKNCTIRSFTILTHHNQIKDKMGRSGGTHWREQKYIQTFLLGSLMAKCCLEDLGAKKEDNIKTDIKEIGRKNVD
jgi:hypothetical protein